MSLSVLSFRNQGSYQLFDACSHGRLLISWVVVSIEYAANDVSVSEAIRTRREELEAQPNTNH